jgi:hypothetical protein
VVRATRCTDDELDVYFTLFRAASFLGEPRKALLEVISTSVRIPWLSIEVLNGTDIRNRVNDVFEIPHREECLYVGVLYFRLEKIILV